LEVILFHEEGDTGSADMCLRAGEVMMAIDYTEVIGDSEVE